MTRQFIASHVRTRIEGIGYALFAHQESGGNSWVEVNDGLMTFGPLPEGCSWRGFMNSGGFAIPVEELPDAVVVDMRGEPT